jgi:stress response protein SCP2
MSSTQSGQRLDQTEIQRRFFDPSQLQYQGTDKQALQQVHQAFTKVANEIIQVLPASRETSLVVTSLEEAQMWAIKAVASNGSGAGSSK